MRLVTIDDLFQRPPEEVDALVQKATELADVYERFLADEERDEHGRAAGIHASEVSGCDRKIVYSLLGTQRKNDIAPVWRRRFKIGHYIHQMFQKDFSRMARTLGGWHISFEEEVPIAPRLQEMAKEWNIFSHCDGVFTIRESMDGPALLRVIVEIKSEAPTSYDALMKKAQPKPDHIEQAHVYMACLNIPLTWFLYYNKGNQNYTGTDANFLVRFNPAIWKDLEDRFRRAHNSAANSLDASGRLIEANLPPRQESVKCMFCAFAWTCDPPSLKSKTRPTFNVLRGPDD